MGLMGDFFRMFFGGGRNVIVETAEVFRTNAEAADARASAHRSAALSQFGAEFQAQQISPFNQLINGLNRLPRPLMAFGVFALGAVSAVVAGSLSERYGRTAITSIAMLASGGTALVIGFVPESAILVVTILAAIWAST